MSIVLRDTYRYLHIPRSRSKRSRSRKENSKYLAWLKVLITLGMAMENKSSSNLRIGDVILLYCSIGEENGHEKNGGYIMADFSGYANCSCFK